MFHVCIQYCQPFWIPLEHYPPSLKYFIVIFTTCTKVLLITSEKSYLVYESLHFSFKWFALDISVWSEVVASNNFPLSTETVLMNDIASFTLSEKGTTILLEWVGLRKQCCRLLCLHKFSHSKTSGHIVAWWRRMLTKKRWPNPWRNIQICSLMVPQHPFYG